MKIGETKFEVLIEQKEIEKRIHKIAKRIQHDFHGEELTIICVLNGAFIFCADLVREFEEFQCRINFIQLKSYGAETVSSENIEMIGELPEIENKNILIVEDIVDTGLSISFLKEEIIKRKPKKLKSCVLLNKSPRRKVEFTPDYICFDLIEDHFIIGYGLDYQYNNRELKQLYYLDTSNE